MTSIKELLEIRKQIKSKKPDFVREGYHKKKRLSKKWRNPSGLHSKVRLKRSGRAKKISVGYRSPKKVRYLHKSGLQQCIIHSVKDLEGLDAKKNCLIISSSLGDRKKIVVLNKAKEHGFNIVNVNDPDAYIKKVQDKISLRKNTKKDAKEKAKDAKIAEKKEEKLTEKAVEEEEQKEIEKKEKDKILTKKDK